MLVDRSIGGGLDSLEWVSGRVLAARSGRITVSAQHHQSNYGAQSFWSRFVAARASDFPYYALLPRSFLMS